MPQFLLADRVRMIDFVAQDQEGHFGQVFHAEQRVELGFRFREPLVVFRVDEEYDPAYFGEVIPPETTGWEALLARRLGRGLGLGSLFTLLMASEVEGGEFHVADGELFRCCRACEYTCRL